MSWKQGRLNCQVVWLNELTAGDEETALNQGSSDVCHTCVHINCVLRETRDVENLWAAAGICLLVNCVLRVCWDPWTIGGLPVVVSWCKTLHFDPGAVGSKENFTKVLLSLTIDVYFKWQSGCVCEGIEERGGRRRREEGGGRREERGGRREEVKK